MASWDVVWRTSTEDPDGQCELVKALIRGGRLEGLENSWEESS